MVSWQIWGKNHETLHSHLGRQASMTSTQTAVVWNKDSYLLMICSVCTPLARWRLFFWKNKNRKQKCRNMLKAWMNTVLLSFSIHPPPPIPSQCSSAAFRSSFSALRATKHGDTLQLTKGVRVQPAGQEVMTSVCFMGDRHFRLLRMTTNNSHVTAGWHRCLRLLTHARWFLNGLKFTVTLQE